MLTGRAQVFAGGYLAVGTGFLPTLLAAAGVVGSAHASGAIVHFPAGVEPEEIAYSCGMQTFAYQVLNEPQSGHIELRVEPLAATPARLKCFRSLPGPDGLGRYLQHLGDDADWIYWSIEHVSMESPFRCDVV
jgi:hypothetical protein